jgi:hypothetical protein
MASPRPLAPPVITATLFSKLFIFFLEFRIRETSMP